MNKKRQDNTFSEKNNREITLTWNVAISRRESRAPTNTFGRDSSHAVRDRQSQHHMPYVINTLYGALAPLGAIWFRYLIWFFFDLLGKHEIICLVLLIYTPTFCLICRLHQAVNFKRIYKHHNVLSFIPQIYWYSCDEKK